MLNAAGNAAAAPAVTTAQWHPQGPLNHTNSSFTDAGVAEAAAAALLSTGLAAVATTVQADALGTLGGLDHGQESADSNSGTLSAAAAPVPGPPGSTQPGAVVDDGLDSIQTNDTAQAAAAAANAFNSTAKVEATAAAAAAGLGSVWVIKAGCPVPALVKKHCGQCNSKQVCTQCVKGYQLIKSLSNKPCSGTGETAGVSLYHIEPGSKGGFSCDRTAHYMAAT